MKKIYFSLLLFFVTICSQAQIYEMDVYQGQTVSTCKGQVTSSVPGGFVGYTGGYANNENRTVTFCSSSGSQIRANFYWISIETGYDFLYVYDGPSTASPLIGTLTGDILYPGVFTSSGTCLTFRFTSDNTQTWGGFNALLGCNPTGCGANPSASDICSSSPTICNLNGYCGNTSGWFTRDNGNIEGTAWGGNGAFSCGSIQNNSWLSFIASATTASFQITSSLCANPSLGGIQAVILNSPNCTSFSSVSNCVNQGAPGTSTLNATGLVVGQKYYIMVDGVDGNDCRYDVTAQSGVQTVNISPITSGACPGQNITFSANVSGGTGPFTYTWAPAPSSGQGTATATYVVGPGGTSYTYTCTIGGACGSSQVATYTITPSSPAVNSVASPTTVCQGASTTLTASGSPSSPNISFTNQTDYNIPDNNATGVSSPVTVSGLPGTVGTTLLNVTVSITHGFDEELDISLQCPNGTIIDLSSDNGGTGDNYINTVFSTTGTPITSGAAPFTGTYTPEQAFSALSGCNLNGVWNLIVKDDTNNDVGVLTGWTITFSNQNTYTWTAPAGGGLAGTTGTSVGATPTATGNLTYTVTATDASGCSNTNTVAVNVVQSPSAVVSNQTYCGGASVPATSFTSNPAGASYTWTSTGAASVGLGTTSGSTTVPAFTASSPATPQTAVISVTPTLNGCPGTAAPYTITVNPRPAVTAMANITNGCQGSTITVPNFTVTPASAIAWTVSPAGSGLAASGTTNIGSFTAGTPGTYTVSVTATASSGGCTTTTPSTFAITINALPNVAANSPTTCSGVATTLTATGATTYTWSTTATTNTISVSPTVNPTTYTVTGTSAGCSNTYVATVTVNSLPAAPTATSVSVCPSATATLTATAPGGTYNWFTGPSGGSSISTGATYTTGSISSPVTYYVQTTDANGCTGPRTPVSVGLHALPTVSASAISQTVCSGSPVSAITFTTNPSTGTSVSWATTGGAGVGLAASGSGNIATYTAPVVGSQTQGTITATVTNTGTGCTNASSPLSGTITINPRPNVLSTSTAVCDGASATVTASGANSYLWNTGAVTSGLTVGPLSTGSTATILTYTVTGTNTSTTCTNTAVATVTVNPRPSVVSTSTAVCSSQSATITASGADTYVWNTSATGANLTINPATTTLTYTVTGTFTATSCTNTATGTITVNPLPTVSSATSSQTVCAGGLVNAITFNTTPSSGVSVNWSTSNGAAVGLPASGNGTITGYTAPNVGAQTLGTITATVTNTGTGCSSLATTTGTITVNPNPVVTSTGTVTPSNCGSSTGSILGVTASGTPALSYSWNGGGAQANPDISNIAAGPYNLVVTDGNGCTTSSPFSVGNPGAPAAPQIDIPTAAICEGGSTTLLINSPNGSSTYTWTGPNGPLGTGTSITVTNATLGDGGNYTASATASGCTGAQSAAAVLTVNANPVPQVTPNSPTAFCSDADVVLSAALSNPGGTATIPANGYQWTIGGNPIPGATSSTYTATVAGNYGLTITNSNGCTASAAVTTSLTNHSEPVLGTPTTIVNSNCVTASGTVSGITTTGGNATYTYSWYNASSSVISTSTTTSDLDSAAAGVYTLIVVDQNGCNDTISATIINDNAPSAPSISGTNPANCSGSANNAITIVSSGGSVTWYSNPALTNVVALDTITYTPLNTVTDTLYVTETSNGCQSAYTEVIITVNETPGTPVASNASVCQGGTVPDLTATVNIGTLNWYSNGTLTTQVGTGSPFATGATTTTTYWVASTNLGCTGTAIPVTVIINDLPTVNVTGLTIDSASCNTSVSDGGISGIAVGGTPNFTYVWSNTAGTVSTSTASPDLVNQPAGNYTLTVTDGNGCISSYGPVTLSSFSAPPTPTFVTSSSDTVYCAGDAVGALSATTGVGVIQWYSDAGLTNQIGTGSPFTPTGITTSTTIYVIANNVQCLSAPRPVNIVFNSLPVVSANSPSVCSGNQATLTGTGGTGTMTYTWDNGVVNGVPFSTTTGGTYVLTGTDANGCVGTATATVTVNALPNVGAVQGTTAATCAGGTVTLTGTGASTYVWSNGVTNGVAFTPSANGSYVVTGTDANGCVNTHTVSVVVNPLPVVDAGAASETIPCGSTNYVLPAATTTASLPVYAWSGPNVVVNGTATPTIGAPGVYTVVVTDGLTGCTAQDMITILSNAVVADFTQDVTSGFNPLTVNFTNQSTGATTYAWSFGDGNSSSTEHTSNIYTAMGTYQVILTAYSNGCSDTASVTIIVNENSSIIIPNIFSPNGDDVNDVLTIESTGIKEMNIDIFNRWGQKIFVIGAPGQSWDGKLANGTDAAEGTYFYILRAVGFDKKEYEQQGPVMLVK